jgi:hypothetical protein
MYGSSTLLTTSYFAAFFYYLIKSLNPVFGYTFLVYLVAIGVGFTGIVDLNYYFLGYASSSKYAGSVSSESLLGISSYDLR